MSQLQLGRHARDLWAEDAAGNVNKASYFRHTGPQIDPTKLPAMKILPEGLAARGRARAGGARGRFARAAVARGATGALRLTL